MESSLDGPSTNALLAVGVTLTLGALFAAIEAGLSRLGQARIHALAESGDARDARIATRVLRDWAGLEARLLVGRLLGMTAAAAASAWLALHWDGLVAVVAAVVLVAFVHAAVTSVAVGMVRRRSGAAVLTLLQWMRPFELLTVPFAIPIRLIGKLMARIVQDAPDTERDRVTELAVEHLIDEGEEEGSIPKDHARMLRSVLEFKDTIAREVMIPRTQMIAFDVNAPIKDVHNIIVDRGHSRYPVFRDRLDQIEGVLYAKDLFRALLDGKEDLKIVDLVRRPAFFVAETQKIGALLHEMQGRRVHLAVVVDEFGGTSGILTLEDILEEIVGDIQDEYDNETPAIQELAPGRFVADAGVSVYDLEDRIGERFAHDGDYESVGGMVVDIAGRVPRSGECVAAGKFEFIVREADERHIQRIEVVRRDSLSAAAGG